MDVAYIFRVRFPSQVGQTAVTVKRARRYILFFAIGLVLAGFLATRMLPARGVKGQLAAIRAARLPASAVELDDWYKAVPAKENRALLLLEATREFVSPPAEIDKKKGDEITPEYEKIVAAYLEKNKTALEKLHRAPELPGSRATNHCVTSRD